MQTDMLKKCMAEVNLPDTKGVLGPCTAVEQSDQSCPDNDQYLCQAGKCRIRFTNWCYPGNELLKCLNVC